MPTTLHATPSAPVTGFAPPVITGTSSEGALDILFQALLDVARRHDPELETVLHGTADISRFSPEMLARALQVQGIWFQLISIAEQNAAMRRRRHTERTEGRAALGGSFAKVFAEARARGIAPDRIQALLKDLRIRPTITAHPTEGKRVTVLEKFRRIYLVLRELEMPRWTDRERNGLMNELRDQIELVWMTGELHLEKATVERRSPGGCTSSTSPCSRCCPKRWNPWRNRSARPTPTRRSRSRPSSSSARGSAATATAIPS